MKRRPRSAQGSRPCQKIASDPIDSSGEGGGYINTKRGSSTSSKNTSAVPKTQIAIIILCPSPPLSLGQFLFHKFGSVPNREPTSNGRSIHAYDCSPEAGPGPPICRFGAENTIDSVSFPFSLAASMSQTRRDIPKRHWSRRPQHCCSCGIRTSWWRLSPA